ncbi:putative protein N(5)-glutamine methyltransferase [Solwaraspora sp. WMMB335]|uniref:putative protein N(5)-glutamine methyltransferase n=1 Tax=Solwaraspora sp. WMMB335 TaxID=3404118 RepID=UPI003B94B6DC
MPVHLSPLTQYRLVDRLRAAGCVFAEDEARLLAGAAATPDRLSVMIGRRCAGDPLEHVLGYAEFCGRRIAVGTGVFVPRRRTALLAGVATKAVRRSRSAVHGRVVPRPVMVELCCGSAAVSAVVLSRIGGDRIEAYAADVDPVAAGYARRNVAVPVFVGDLYQPLPAGLRRRIDVLVANVPYVPTKLIELLPAEARRHEPRHCLDGGPDGLDLLRRVVRDATSWLAPGGRLLVEVSAHQTTRAATAARGGGLTVEVVTDARLDATVMVGRPRHPPHRLRAGR